MNHGLAGTVTGALKVVLDNFMRCTRLGPSESSSEVSVVDCLSDCTHCFDIEKQERALALEEDEEAKSRDRPTYFISKEDSHYQQLKRQVDLLNDTSLNLDNVIPLRDDSLPSSKRRRLNAVEFDEEEEVKVQSKLRSPFLSRRASIVKEGVSSKKRKYSQTMAAPVAVYRSYLELSELKKFLPLAIAKPQAQLALYEWRGKDAIQIKLADLEACIGGPALERIVANLTEFKVDEDIQFQRDPRKAKVNRMYLHFALR